MDVVVHEDDVRRLRLLPHRLNHVAGEAACAACVRVRMDADPVRLESLRIEGAAVVGDMHGEVTGDIVYLRTEDTLLDDIDITADELLFLECRRADC